MQMDILFKIVQTEPRLSHMEGLLRLLNVMACTHLYARESDKQARVLMGPRGEDPQKPTLLFFPSVMSLGRNPGPLK